jgi:hypothetical protein
MGRTLGELVILLDLGKAEQRALNSLASRVRSLIQCQQ